MIGLSQVVLTWGLSRGGSQMLAAVLSRLSWAGHSRWLAHVAGGDTDCWLTAQLELSTECLHMAATCVMGFGQHSGCVTKGSILRTKYSKTQEREAASLLRFGRRNWHIVTSAVFCWSEQSQSLPRFNGRTDFTSRWEAWQSICS